MRSGIVALVSRLVIAVIQLGSTLVLARLLAPEDFGVVAIVAALTSFVPMLIDLGLTDSTVQNPKITPAQISALFWISLGVASLVALLLYLGSPLIASLYKQPSIGTIATAWGASFVLYGLSLQHMALLRRAMLYKDIAIIEILASAVSTGVSLTMAYLGFGYWALVMRPIVAGVITVIGSWIRCDWKPGAARIDSEVKSMLKFGMNVTGGAVAWIGTNSVDRIALGYFYPPGLIGLYQNALMLYENALLGISIPLHKVGVSALSKLRDDPNQLARKYTGALTTVSFYSMPAFACLAVIASDLVPILLGPKWAFSGTILTIFAIRGLVNIIENSQTWLLMPLGHAHRWVRWATFTAGVQTCAVFAGLPFGVEGVAISVVIARSAMAFPAVLFAGRPIGLTFKTLIGAVGRPLAGAIIALLAGKAVVHVLPHQTGGVGRVILGASTCLIIYGLLVVGLFRVRQPLELASGLLKGFLPTRFHRWLPFPRKSD